METFRAIRKRLGLTQVEMAIELGIRQASVSRMENSDAMDRKTSLALEALVRRKMDQDHTHGDADMSQYAGALQSNRSQLLDADSRA